MTKDYNHRHTPTVVVLWSYGKNINVINPHLRMMLRHTATMRKVR